MKTTMRIRPKTLWRVPVLCTLGSWISYYLTIYLGGFFFVVKTVRADGVTEVSADRLRVNLFHGVIFLAVLLCGWLLVRSMSRAEIAVSAGILTAVYLALDLVQLYGPGFPVEVSLFLAEFRELGGVVGSWLLQLTGNFTLSVLLADFYPFLFVFFGRRKIPAEDAWLWDA